MKRKKKDAWKFTEKKRKNKKVYISEKKEIHEQFGRKVSQDINGNRKLFWKEVSKANREKVES